MLATPSFHTVAFSRMRRRWQLRAGPGALIVLAHLMFLALLIRHAGTPSIRDDAPPADYITFSLVPAKPKPAQAPAPTTTLPALRKRPAAVQWSEPAPRAPAVVPAEPQDAAPAQDAPQGKRLDMDALRTAARRVEQERVPTALERLRESEQIRSQDDSPLVRGIQRARRPDCRTAYAGGDKANILVLIPLAIDTIRDKGCKW